MTTTTPSSPNIIQNRVTTVNSPVSPSPSSVIKRTSLKVKRSPAWRYFQTETSSLNAGCILCKLIIKRATSTTSNLLYHLAHQHPNEYKLISKLSKQSFNNQTRLPLGSERGEQLTRLAVEFIIHDLLPLSTIESPKLQAIFHEAEPSSNLPKRKYLMTNILQHMYNEIRDLVIEQLKDSLGICITTDNWTSDCNQPYITVTSHLITSNYELKTFVLQTTQFSGNHTADRITQALQDICIEWGILDKIVC
ncbi:unnamed protein product [Didymodactylos carnosus]|uniref:BED-type domain-containing protein n=1 Tax=Didymodactylos carnosus TaxID=1234261 RepID=A0A8S2WQ22_9BILA|nr:unnamed protein product [Didymodactylos carnosus]